MVSKRNASLLQYAVRRHARASAVLAVLMVLSALTEGFGFVLLVPMLAALAPEGASAGGHVANLLRSAGVPLALAPLLGLFFLIVVLRAFVGHWRALAGLRLRSAIVDGLRKDAWSALLHCEWRVLATMRQSRSASQLLGNVERVGDGVDRAISGFATAVTLGGMALASVLISPHVTAAAIAGGALVLLVFGAMRRRAGRLGHELGHAYDRFAGELHQGLAALRIIKSFGREAEAEQRVLAELGKVRDAELAFRRGLGLGQIALQSSAAMVLLLVIWFATSRWHADQASLLPFVALFARTLPLVGVLQEDWQAWAHAQPAFLATMSIVEQAQSAREEDRSSDAPALRLPIELNDVSVFWHGRALPALDRVSLSIPARGLVALAGSSGAGKSTLADLIGGLISPDSGSISAGGVRLENGLRRAWRERVAYVQQDPVLFAGTIRDNLKWAAPETGDERLWRAIDDASAGFVRKLDGGLDALLGEGGRQLSGGERQRIVLARALLRDPALLILDEATSALDSENEAGIVAVLQGLKHKLAILVVSHRGQLLKIADSIVTLETGRVVSVENRRGSSRLDRTAGAARRLSGSRSKAMP